MNARIYLRASTKEQDAYRAEQELVTFCENNHIKIVGKYIENYTGTKLKRPMLGQLLSESNADEILLVESVDRLSRLSLDEWHQLKAIINEKELRLIVADLPTTHTLISDDDLTSNILKIVNNMLLDLMATMARQDNDKRRERIKQGLARAKSAGKNIGGRSKNKATREKVARYSAKNLGAEEVAKLADCSVATVYRIKKEIQLAQIACA
ncbi:recombinase family protein [Pseudoalteromonas sp. MMG012]|uniref:recombinase family protein n=1 Tax=Pseudoalteromonas sp. MMG012 TaxID=2822686 RepID=UPI002899D412|nr:recombinase family protein [Pseudoalteromonas sp. MMG012]